MKKMTLTTFGGAAALAVAVGFAGLGAGTVSAAPTPAAPAHTAASVAPAGAHHGVLTACIIGLNC
ncbi:hypothetical protein [Mycobacterium sherrisii]|uniref:Uncharacterized protein n=1 Tax=Mycobacterium sherrisii TaxID=243061 RepID=A0A1E3SIQ9_9MYCO|nr:hypothetical protein [Mycobacterium sherrisii]MCV7028366.1 hypothetical protein [Mycobacterium sherrisii]MEC4764925.1 hypothetical protein [Mycobacterium sherrisii]ODR01448.1 hypothetical protein BHQ21_23505 [Mycobacterium sherrisii]ORW87412.1 hypothetical protein AWC25_00840 [Mycobacterium sherrisii]